MNQKGFLNFGKMALVFAAASFLTGFLLIDRSSISGNAVVVSNPVASPISLVGLALIFISIGLAAYGIRR